MTCETCQTAATCSKSSPMMASKPCPPREAVMLGWNYLRLGPDVWIRLLGVQVGFHAHGRRRYFSEREGIRKGPTTIRVGRRAEVSIGKVRRTW